MLTSAGVRLLQYAEKILDLAAEARNAIADDDVPTGTLTITAPETVCAYRLPVVLERFRSQFPRVELIFRPLATGEGLEQQLLEGKADAALVISEPQQSSSLVFERLQDEPIHIVTYPGHRLASQRRIALADLRGETLLLTEAGCSYRSLFERILKRVNICPSTVFEFHSVEAIKQCTLGGLGVAILPDMAVCNEIAAGRLVALSILGAPMKLVTFLAWHKDKWHSPALRAFLAVTRAILTGADPVNGVG